MAEIINMLGVRDKIILNNTNKKYLKNTLQKKFTKNILIS